MKFGRRTREPKPIGLAILAVMAAVLGVAFSSTASFSAPSSKSTVSVFAATSLAGAFGEIVKDYERANPGTKVQLNLAGSQQLAAQVEQGARADVFASADERWMAELVAHARVVGEAATFARNRLVVIVPRVNPARIGRPSDLAKRGVKLVIGADAVPVGRYGREMLAKLGGSAGYEAGWTKRVLANVVSEEENVRGVVGKVQLGEADAGICYRSDVTPAVARLVRMFEIPAEANVIATYPIAVLAGAPQAGAAKAFVAHVLSAGGQRVLERHGLIPVSAATP